MGRIKKREEDKRKMIMVSIKPEVLELLNAKAKASGLNRSKFIEKLVVEDNETKEFNC